MYEMQSTQSNSRQSDLFPKSRKWRARPRAADVEGRRSPRVWQSGPVWWREALQGESNIGWMLESSDSGAAFLVRGAAKPLAGIRIYTNRDEGDERNRDALVRRVESIHSDLCLVAVQFAGAPATVCH
ncbi:MAG: hypothetical protein IPK83_01205 [Planctomycetes bacterium]|nr:hypothetical protein [Planctomycetota bacterium]